MNKITDIFKLEKWWVKRITLIVTTLVLAGCQSQAIPSTATATATSTEIPATATLTPTNTPEPTATATELVLPDNAVRIVGGGYAYVENDKVLQVGKDGVTKEIKDISTDVVFENMGDAGDIFEVLLAEAISKYDRLDFFPPGLYDTIYTGKVDGADLQKLVQKESCDSEGIGVVGIPRAFAKIENFLNYPGYPELGIAFMQINGHPGLVPMVIGAFDEAGKFSTTLNNMRNFNPDGVHFAFDAPNESLDPIFTAKLDWEGLQKVLKDDILYFYSLISVSPDEVENLDYGHAPQDPLTPAMEGLRDKLIHFQAKIMGAAGYAIRTTHKLPLPNPGILLDMVDDQKQKFFIVPLPGPPALIHADLK
ncbi:MAG: hypothetical protein HOP27_05250 [Anaerolineales bacterium]|nr:hypothetical protein [Anaerolineales bacterium]